MGFEGYIGFGFAINNSFTVNSTFNIGHFDQIKLNDKTAFGTGEMPMSMGVGFAYRTWKHFIWNFSVNFGLNSEASDVMAGTGISIIL